MRTLMASLWRDERGQDLVEYVLLVVLIAVAATAAMTTFGREANDAFQQASSQFDDAVN